jgi:hypothetical protein
MSLIPSASTKKEICGSLDGKSPLHAAEVFAEVNQDRNDPDVDV